MGAGFRGGASREPSSPPGGDREGPAGGRALNTPPHLSELLLLSPRPETDPAFQELAERLGPVVAPVPVRLCRGDGSADPAPEPGAGLIAGGGPDTLALLTSMRTRNSRSPGERPAGWSWVHLTSSGPDPFDGWGDLPGNPLLTYSRGVNARSVAEWILGAILYFYRDFGIYSRAAESGRWERRWARELSGRTMVVVGAGTAGSEAAKLASALNLQSIGVSRSGRPLPGFDRVIPLEELESVWGAGDVTVVLLPLTPETRGSLGAAEIARLRRGSVLLVASRGGIVNEEAVIEAVRSGHLAGAGFDVFAEEPLPPESPLWREPRLLLTPHVAGTSDRFMERTAEIVTGIWRGWHQGEALDRLDRYRFAGGHRP